MLQAKRLFAALSLCLALPACALASDFPGAAIITGTVDQYSAACNADLGKASAEIARLKAMKAPRNTLQALAAFDNAVMAINFAANRSEAAQSVLPDEAMRNAAEKCGQDAVASQSKINLDRGVYDAIAALDVSKSDEATRYLVKQTLSDFRRAGVDRDEVTRAKIAALNDEIAKIGQEFNKNIAKGGRTASFTMAELDGMPEDYKKAHPAGADGQVVLTTSYPDYLPFMKYARSAAARERFLPRLQPARFPGEHGGTRSPDRKAL